MSHPPTSQQSSYYSAGTDPRAGSIALCARAGTGKTHTQRELARLLPGSGLATSVLKSTIKDLAAAMPQNWEVKGLHALGYAGIRKKIPSVKLDTGGNALYEFVKETLKDDETWWKSFPDIKALVEQTMLAGIVPTHERFATPDTEDEWNLLADRFDIDMTPQVYETARSAVIHLNQLALGGRIQFTHMLTLPLFFGFPVNQYPKIIVDEAQDLNILQHLMVGKALRHNGRVFITGDDRQAIMAFSGALSNSFHELVNKFDCTVLPLTVSWRCPRAVIEVAQRYVPDIQAAPNAIEGSVIEAAPDGCFRSPPHHTLPEQRSPHAPRHEALRLRLLRRVRRQGHWRRTQVHHHSHHLQQDRGSDASPRVSVSFGSLGHS